MCAWSSLSKDLSLYILDFCTFNELFGTIYLVNQEFNDLCLSVESIRLRRKLLDADIRNRDVCIVTKQRTFRLPIENHLKFKGPFKNLYDAILYVADHGMIIIVTDGCYGLELDIHAYADILNKNIEIVGLPSQEFGVMIQMHKILQLCKNVVLTNLKISKPFSDLAFLAVAAYAHLQITNCVFTNENNAPISHFIEVAIAGCLTINSCNFQGTEIAIQIDNKAHQIHIQDSIFQNMNQWVDYNHNISYPGCIEFNDKYRKQRALYLRNFKDDRRKITKSGMILRLTGNIFKDIDNKHPFIETAYDRQSIQADQRIYNNYIDDNDNDNDANKIHYIHPQENSSYHESNDQD